MESNLNTTSYAILSQLSLRSWSAYDLTKEMRRNLHFFWPRAESRIYDEIKRLERAGLAEGTASFTGRRRRMTYAITSAGTAALEAWLDQEPTSGAILESEGLLRVFAATSAEHVRAGVEAIRAEAAELRAQSVSVGREFAEGRHDFQERVRFRALAHDFLAEYALLLEQWAERGTEAIDAWDGADADEIERQAVARIAEHVERLDIGEPASVED